MPKMGESIAEGTIINWMINEGDSFEEGDILLEVATDKVDNEVPAPASGKMLEHKFKAKDIVPIGEVIAVLEISENKNFEKPISKSSEKKEKAKTSVSTPNSISSVVPPSGARGLSKSFKVNENVFISPLVDNIARKNHISYEELARISGTGKDGRLRKSDVSYYLENGRPFQFAQAVPEVSGFQIPDLKFDKGKGKIVEMDRMRQMIADHMVFSASTAPHVTAYVEADLTDMVNWRNKNKAAFQKKYNEKLTFTPLFIECVAKAITDFPMINSTLDGTNIIVKDEINIGMATALPSGNLIVPVVKNADKMNLKELAESTNELVGKARDNKLKADDTKGSTFTISNVGTFGSLMGTPIINQPEAAILATGIIKKRAEVMERKDGDTIEIRQMMYLSLSFDHRIVDGYLAGSFLRRIADYMEQFDMERTF
ncbi:Dihydrolipoyllysine-residue acetyltransferase component of pyruvate dehydrogenase complex [Aequorivita lipolytica]|uniref:Dihydrolipoamide acetyltransferase component of pyruvate dehydrogenase complex n=2 Tax=Aequorivita lipolytica TaxID=153267 RepID=A0A5C6YU26_9FLAO|nr:2-oxo acid dehydrogenase subunit E2 [Aequorivita lipolytica]SRX49857.1 Dihydrolipoyllysine-residue acetyltransferase component of pyruvate dehydrogenase complex [Aequorivita lipolytica]